MGYAKERGATRIPYACELECTGAGEDPLNPRISDLSATGAFIDSLNAVPAGTRLSLKFALPTGPVTVEAEVVHAMPHFGMGVRFLDLSEDQRRRIEELVAEVSSVGASGGH
jgi:uncharacterized protein (TIGR02266 family)